MLVEVLEHGDGVVYVVEDQIDDNSVEFVRHINLFLSVAFLDFQMMFFHPFLDRISHSDLLNVVLHVFAAHVEHARAEIQSQEGAFFRFEHERLRK